jgi:hypothetical protein
MTYDYLRNGVTTLFAAFDVLEGTVLGRCMQRHRHQEFLRFLGTIERAVPPGKVIHVILDNYGSHKHPKVLRWLGRHPRFVFHFTPTSGSWLLKRRGLAGVKLVISDAHEGIKAAVARVFRATWQRCRVHFMRNALAHAGKSGRRVASAFNATAFAQDDADAAKAQWRQVADQVRTKLPKLAGLLDEAEEDVLAYMSFPKEHRAKIHSRDTISVMSGSPKTAAIAAPCGREDTVRNP